MVQTCENRGQVRKCSAVSFELSLLDKAVPLMETPLRLRALCSQDCSAKSAEASPVFPGDLVSWFQLFRWLNRESSRG